ncbi:hypothetical protein D3C73_1568240 [compost metagenome]
MLFPAVLRSVFQGRVLHPVRKIGLEPVTALRTYPQVSAGLPVNPAPEVDPVHDLIAALAVPGHVFAQMAV